MNYGLQLAASGALTNLYRMDVLANNLANVNTPGFKPDVAGIRQREPERVEAGRATPANTLLERLGGGVFAASNYVNHAQGEIATTGRDYDVAIQGSGFFVVRDESDNVTGDRYRLTRDGRFLRDAQGRLASATTGMPVMDVSNRPIVLRNDGPIQIDENGVVKQRGAAVAQIQLTDVPDRSRLNRLGAGLYLAPADVMGNSTPGTGVMRQRALEASGADPVATLMGLTELSRSIEMDTVLIQGHDRIADRAINNLGRVA